MPNEREVWYPGYLNGWERVTEISYEEADAQGIIYPATNKLGRIADNGLCYENHDSYVTVNKRVEK